MKYIILLIAILFGSKDIVAQKTSEQDYSGIVLKGKISNNSENENNDPDPAFTASAISTKIPVLDGTTSSTRLIDLENGLKMLNEVVSKLIQQKYSFSILPQHKYMINNCLGVKASVGNFGIQFSKPEIKVNEAGKVTIKLIVDEIHFDALKVRIRPCQKDLQCHFGERFKIGGLAREISMTVTMDPMAAIAASTGACTIAFQGSMPIKWRIGKLNLQPLQNNLDDVAKQMIEDALNASTLNIFTDKFLEIAKKILPQYFTACTKMYSPGGAKEVVKANSKEKNGKSGNENTEEDQNEEENETEKNTNSNNNDKWVISPSGAKGATGNVTISLMKGSQWYLYFQTTQGKDLVRLDNTAIHSLIPGKYNITVSSVPLLEVPVLKGMNTRIKAGTLNVSTAGTWGLYDENEKINYVTHHYPMKLGLPAGKYAIYLNGQFLQIEIKDGEVTEF